MLTHSHLCPSCLSGSLALFHPLSHTPPLSPPLLVCTHSNCVSSHFITLRHTLPPLLISISRAHAQKEAHQPTATCDVIWLILSSLLSLYILCRSLIVCVYFSSSFVDTHFFLWCLLHCDSSSDLRTGLCFRLEEQSESSKPQRYFKDRSSLFSPLMHKDSTELSYML